MQAKLPVAPILRASPLNVARCLRMPLPCRLDYCHRKGVVNRDIKLENTLLQVCMHTGMHARACACVCMEGGERGGG
jgi:hypothetical protein